MIAMEAEMKSISVDEEVMRYLEHLAMLSRKSVNEILRGFLKLPSRTDMPAETGRFAVPVYCEYKGSRVSALFDETSRAMRLLDAAGGDYRTPSAAAKEVKKRINGNNEVLETDGWRFFFRESDDRPIGEVYPH